MVRDRLLELTGDQTDVVIPVEIVSYPDTAGAKSLTNFLDDLVSRSQN
jgi:hypothetical protein